MTLKFLLLLALSPGVSAAGEAIMPHLPDLYSFQYRPAARDPFISPDASKTLVRQDVEPDGSFGDRAAQRYLHTLIQAISDDLFVEGVSTGDQGTPCIAVINGVTFTEGEKIPVMIPENDLVPLAELARTYGLPLEQDKTEKNTILLAVGPIDSAGVAILLPGFKAALCKLPYIGDTAEERITLKRKKGTPDGRHGN